MHHAHSSRFAKSPTIAIPTLASCIVSWCTLAAPLYSQELSIATFRGALEHTARNLYHCHLTAANRTVVATPIVATDEETRRSTDAAMALQKATFLELWLSGDNVQFRAFEGQGDFNDSTWWKDDRFKPSASPIAPKTLLELPGNKVFLRTQGEFTFADVRAISDNQNLPYEAIYSRGKSADYVLPLFYLPLIDIGRNWSTDRERAWLPVNTLLSIPVSSWRLVGPAKLRGEDTILVEVSRRKTKTAKVPKHGEQISYTPVWKVWFSTDPGKGFFPLKMESSTLFEFRGKQFQVERPDESRAAIVFEAFEIRQYGDGIWLPSHGRQDLAASADPSAAFSYDLTSIVELYIRDGKVVDNSKYELGTRNEWRLLSLEKITPTDGLWCEPTEGAMVIDNDTNTKFMVGLTPSQTAELLARHMTPSQSHVLRWVLLCVNAAIITLILARIAWRRRSHS